LKQSCIFCRIVHGEIPSTALLENDTVLAFRDIQPQAPVHVLVVPKAHVDGIRDLPADSDVWGAILSAVQNIVALEGLAGGFRIVINDGEDGGQTVPHLHVHVLGKRAMQWPPG
jgi:histidine triad (HIT) family protein